MLVHAPSLAHVVATDHKHRAYVAVVVTQAMMHVAAVAEVRHHLPEYAVFFRTGTNLEHQLGVMVYGTLKPVIGTTMRTILMPIGDSDDGGDGILIWCCMVTKLPQWSC